MQIKIHLELIRERKEMVPPNSYDFSVQHIEIYVVKSKELIMLNYNLRYENLEYRSKNLRLGQLK